MHLALHLATAAAARRTIAAGGRRGGSESVEIPLF